MDFENYILLCLRNRPVEVEWQRHMFYVAVGLVSEATELVGLMQQRGDFTDTVERSRVMRRIERLEFYRALAYYQLDLRPGADLPSPQAPVSGLDAAMGLAVQAGRVAALVNGWMFHREWLDDRMRFTMGRLEAHRGALYQALNVNATEIWTTGGATAYATKPMRSRIAASAIPDHDSRAEAQSKSIQLNM